MKPVTLGFALLALAAAPVLPTGPVAHAGAKCPVCATGINICGASGPVKWADHHNPSDARYAVDTENGKVTLLLTDRVVAVQLAERTVHKVKRELRRERKEQDHWLGEAIVAAVSGTVNSLIDRSFECRIRDLRDVRYEDGRLEFVGNNGKLVFHDTELNDTDLATAFSEQDAKRFVQEFRKAKSDLMAALR